MNEWILLIPAILIHELGHYVGFRMFGYKPKIQIKWYGILIGENCFFKLNPLQAYLVSIMGIISGLIILWSFSELVYIYLIMSSIDIVNILSILSFPRERYKLTMLENIKLNISDLESKLKKELFFK